MADDYSPAMVFGRPNPRRFTLSGLDDKTIVKLLH